MLFIILVCGVSASCADAQTNAPQFWRRDSAMRVHDPSTIVRDGDTFWMFCTGRGVKSFSSTNLHGWHPEQSVMPEMPAWVRGVVPTQRGYYWAPDVIRVGDRWLLYYSVSSFGRNTSAIGLAINPTLNPADRAFRWTDEGIVVRSDRTNNYNAIDPAAVLSADNRLWLTFGSYWSGIKLIELDPQAGHRIAPDSPMYSLAWNDRIEAPFIYQYGTNYYLFVNWGECCQGTNSTYEIRVGRSARITGPYRDREGKEMLHGGGTRVLGSEGRFIGPGHAGIVRDDGQEWFSFHFYDGDNRGRPTLAVRRLTWDREGWPRVARAAEEEQRSLPEKRTGTNSDPQGLHSKDDS